uniref:hypothetical protein n=1 Tax=Kingella denitrificans TaxID=502 RepID=UPI001C9AF3E7
IVNREGVYQTGDYLNKVVGEYIVTTWKRDAGKLRSLKSFASKAFDEKDYVRVTRFTGMDEGARAKSSCTTELRGVYTLDENNCRND